MISVILVDRANHSLECLAVGKRHHGHEECSLVGVRADDHGDLIVLAGAEPSFTGFGHEFSAGGHRNQVGTLA